MSELILEGRADKHEVPEINLFRYIITMMLSAAAGTILGCLMLPFLFLIMRLLFR